MGTSSQSRGRFIEVSLSGVFAFIVLLRLGNTVLVGRFIQICPWCNQPCVLRPRDSQTPPHPVRAPVLDHNLSYHQDRSMDSAKTVLHSIELATQQVRSATARYSTTKKVRKVRQHSLIRLEFEFQTIANASRAILKVLDDPLLCRHYMLDDRLVDWLSGTEPETCLDVLIEMAKLLSIEREVQIFSGITPPSSACEEDDINAAIVLFHSHKAHFHFLLTMDIW